MQNTRIMQRGKSFTQHLQPMRPDVVTTAPDDGNANMIDATMHIVHAKRKRVMTRRV